MSGDTHAAETLEPDPVKPLTTTHPNAAQRRNFALHLVHGGTTMLAGRLASPDLILPLLMTAIAAPTMLFGLVMPVFKACVLLPQLAISGQMRAFKKRKWLWAGTALARAPILLTMVAVAALLPASVAGVLLVVLAGMYGVAISLGILSFIDLYGKTIPAGQRGLVLARRASVGGVMALGLGLVVQRGITTSDSLTPYLILLSSAALMWVISAAVAGSMIEDDSPVDARRNPLKELRASLGLLRTLPALRHFVSMRALLVIIDLSLPFFALGIAHFTGTDATNSLGIFIIAVALSEILGNIFWGRYADRASRLLIAGAAGLASLAGLAVLAFSLLPPGWQHVWLYAIPYLGVNFAIAGVRLGSDTYLIDATPDTDRPVFVALSNTVVGIVGLSGALLGGIAALVGLRAVFVLLVSIATLGALTAYTLPDSTHMLDHDIAPEHKHTLRELAARSSTPRR